MAAVGKEAFTKSTSMTSELTLGESESVKAFMWNTKSLY